MHKLLYGAALLLSGCSVQEDAPPAKEQQAAKGAAVVQQILSHSAQNAEQENIGRRLKLTMNPGQIGFILLMNQAGQPIAYYGVRGKITSSTKRLTKPDEEGCYSDHACVRAAPSDEGTYGSSDPYVYFWSADGQYIQWNGAYLYSDKPFRTRVQPLVIALGEKA